MQSDLLLGDQMYSEQSTTQPRRYTKIKGADNRG
jgi:hypothetical protein